MEGAAPVIDSRKRYGGGFAIGAGNSVPGYVPVKNYLTAADEALRDEDRFLLIVINIRIAVFTIYV
jgi:hypothetical protein